MRSVRWSILVILLTAGLAPGQSAPDALEPILSTQIQTAEVTAHLLREYVMPHVPPLPTPQSPEQWTSQARQIRRHLLDDIVFHGWPKEWVNSAPRFEDVGTIATGDGYRMRKLRYEIVPGFASTAILYEPANPQGKVPAVLNVNGHVGPEGKAVEYKQKRCINFAKRGMFALNLEWLGMGELDGPENEHDFAAHLDLVGVNGVGLFYLAMRRGLDYLYDHPNVDRQRLAVTGLSGGGWQTILLSALDERVAVGIPVAGFASLTSGTEHPEEIGDDIEQNATDFRDGQDYTDLVAMRAPRPTLLIYNAEDDCCFRAAQVKPYVYDNIKPFFRLFGKEDALAWHENLDPATHNYQVDNRQAAYRFLNKYFDLAGPEAEIPVDSEIKTYDELKVGLPKDNLTILGLARRFATGLQRPSVPPGGVEKAPWVASERTQLKALVRYQPVAVKHAWAFTSTKHRGLETRSYRFELSNGLSATGVWLKSIAIPDNAPIAVVLNDKGKKGGAAQVSDRVNRGEQVLALDVLFFGDASPEKETIPYYTQLLGTIGDRPIGMEAAQLIAIIQWLLALSRAPKIRIETTGIRSQVLALIACDLEPALAAELSTHSGMRSLGDLLDKPVTYDDAPDLFCLDIYKEFDIDDLTRLAEPAKVTQSYAVEGPSK
ncbi:MAG: prolyl oligopeptidase family serine peptidase [Terriglobia bacterium]|jgi:dienelactone hydrolase